MKYLDKSFSVSMSSSSVTDKDWKSIFGKRPSKCYTCEHYKVNGKAKCELGKTEKTCDLKPQIDTDKSVKSV